MDTAFGIFFIIVAVVIFFPAVFMLLFETFGPTPPPLDGDVGTLGEKEMARLSKSPEGMTFIGLTVGWFIAGAVIPFAIAITSLQAARRIFREARTGILKAAALLSVLLLYVVFTLFSLYYPS